MCNVWIYVRCAHVFKMFDQCFSSACLCVYLPLFVWNADFDFINSISYILSIVYPTACIQSFTFTFNFILCLLNTHNLLNSNKTKPDSKTRSPKEGRRLFTENGNSHFPAIVNLHPDYFIIILDVYRRWFFINGFSIVSIYEFQLNTL